MTSLAYNLSIEGVYTCGRHSKSYRCLDRTYRCGKRLLLDKGRAYLIGDRDSTFGPSFARVAATSGIKILKTPYHAKRPNAICERFLGSVRRECLDHLFIMQEKQLHRVLGGYVQYFNQARPHQGIRQQIPERYGEPVLPDHDDGKILALPVLGGLHHDYREIRLSSYKFTTELMVALCGAHLIEDLAYRRSLLLACTEKDNHREDLPFLMRTLKATM